MNQVTDSVNAAGCTLHDVETDADARHNPPASLGPAVASSKIRFEPAMSSTAAGHTPARFGLPRKSGIPTPGRPRSVSGIAPEVAGEYDAHTMTKALADAMRANNPAQHRENGMGDSLAQSTRRPSVATRASQASSLVRPTSSTSSHSSSLSLRMPVAAPRDHSAPRTPLSATASRTPGFRTKTPTSAAPNGTFATPAPPLPRSSVNSRSQSRQSDMRSSSRLGNVSLVFNVGDHVRIESLDVDGILRFHGETEFKPGEWAGVELVGVFAGKGKNDGSVAGVQYFNCLPNCGVFVASSKLSLMPTRPASVASSRSGRATPSYQYNRPSTSQGVRTPAPIMKRALTSVENNLNISVDSRAGKYVGVTAKQLSARKGSDEGNAPSYGTQTTPKAPGRTAIGATPKARPSLGPSLTPKATRTLPRSPMPDMPPPPSPVRNGLQLNGYHHKPITPTLSQTSSETYVDDPLEPPGGRSDELRSLESNNKALQDKIARLISGAGLSPPRGGAPHTASASTSPTTSYIVDDPRDAQITDLQARIAQLEASHHQVKLDTEREHGRALESVSARLEALEEEKKAALARSADLQAQLKPLERSLKERQDKIDALDRAALHLSEQTEKNRLENEAKMRDAAAKAADAEALVVSLKEAIDAKASVEEENGAIVQAKNMEIGLLSAQVARVCGELEEERRELGGQVDELRQAGQETIALYEERLSASETVRYELEDTIAALEEKLRAQTVPPNPAELARQASTAAEIDNETLKEQLSHLTSKISTLEDTLEDTRAAQERDEEAVKARIVRYKENEGLLKKEVVEMRKEEGRAVKAEVGARARVDELMEALRENSIALENARNEVEGLRLELANLEGLQSGETSENPAQDDTARKAANDKAKLVSEIALLKEQLAASSSSDGANETMDALRAKLESSDVEKAELEHVCEEAASRLLVERQTVAELQQALEQSANELSALRKAGNRDHSAVGTPNGKEDGSTLRNQLLGMKHIVEDLTQENATLSSKNKLLESENKLLTSETEELHQSVKALEDSMEESILQDEKALEAETASAAANGDDGQIQRLLQENKAESEQLRKQLAEVEKKHTRTVHDLNKEISELENLVEAKIYREDDLERELEKCKQKLSQAQKPSTSRHSGESMLSSTSARPSSTYSLSAMDRSSISATAQLEDPDVDDDTICEVCGQKGHDILSCQLVFSDAPKAHQSPKTKTAAAVPEVWCEDCESRSHSTMDCPHSQDVF